MLSKSVDEVYLFLKREKCCDSILNAIRSEKIDGKSLLILNERDIYRLEHKYHLLLGDLKRFSLVVNKIQQQNRQCLIYLGILDNQNNLITNLLSQNPPSNNYPHHQPHHHQSIYSHDTQIDRISPENSVDGSSSGRQYATCIQPELFKTTISLGKAGVAHINCAVLGGYFYVQKHENMQHNRFCVKELIWRQSICW